MSNIAVGLSGGVDSAVCAALLKEQGHNVIGITLRLFDSFSAEDAQKVAEKLNIPIYIADLREDFKNLVIENFASEYKRGRTPNPCVVCNKHIKFGKMLDFAKKNGAEFLATGHYASIENRDGKVYLKKAIDVKKDQSYFLYRLNQEVLKNIIMPLSDIPKTTTKSIADELGLFSNEKKESQEICFIPDNDYAKYIEHNYGISPKGNILFEDKVVGEHCGIIHYTVGQRRGLKIALGERVYVSNIDATANTITLSRCDGYAKGEVRLSNINFVTDVMPENFSCTAKIRYRAKDVPVEVSHNNNTAVVRFKEPQNAPTPGQSVVFYDDDTVIGGGIIDA